MYCKKQNVLKKGLMAGMLSLSLICSQQSKALVWVASTLPATNVNTGVTPSAINCANITYLPHGPVVNSQLGAICWGDTLYVFDDLSHSARIRFITGGAGTPSNPDVVLGNSSTSMGSNVYTAGVVFEQGGNIYLNTYRVANPGTSAFNVPSTPLTTIAIATGGTYHNPHIDLIAEADNLFGGYPYCSQYAITYDDGVYIYGRFGDLNAGVYPANITFTSTSPTGTFHAADVAAVQVAASGGGPENYARFVFQASPTNTIIEAECSFNPASATTVVWPHTIMYPPSGYTMGTPRIDAIDNYHINAGPVATYEAVASRNGTTAPSYVFAFNPLSAFPMAASLTDQGAHNSAAVAAGPFNKYLVSYYTDAQSGTGIPARNIVGQTIDYSTGTLSDANVYQIPYTSNLITSSSDPLFNGVSASCNNNTSASYSLTCWWAKNPAGIYQLSYKYTGAAIAFREPNTAVNTVNNEPEITAAPNPAVDQLQVNGLNGECAFSVFDMNGRKFNSGNLTSASQRIDVSGLSAGMYILQLNSANGAKTVKFVKQ